MPFLKHLKTCQTLFFVVFSAECWLHSLSVSPVVFLISIKPSSLFRPQFDTFVHKECGVGRHSLWDDSVSADHSRPDAARLHYVLCARGNRGTIVGRLETPSLLPLPTNPGELGENTGKGIHCFPFFQFSPHHT